MSMKFISPNDLIAVDADNVFFDFNSPWEAVVRRVTGRPLDITPGIWALEGKYNLTQDELAECWRQFNEGEEWGRMEAFPGAADWMNAALDAGIRVAVVTSINPAFIDLRREAYRKAGVDPARLAIHCAGAESSKLDIFRKIKPLLHIDDHGKHLGEAMEAGVPVRVLHQGFLLDCQDATHTVDALASLQLDQLDIHLRTPARRPGYTL
jgi:hypothetical protein